MWNILGLVGLVGILVANPAQVLAQAPSADDLILRPGDTITWSPSAPHRVRFGGTVTHNGKPLDLTPFATIEGLLEITPTLKADASGVAMAATGDKVTATVKSTAAAGTSFFTCGFIPHNGMMATVAFKIEARQGQPARTIEIVSANPPSWLLKTATGDKNLNRP